MWILRQLSEILYLLVVALAVCIIVPSFLLVVILVCPALGILAIFGGMFLFLLWILGAIGGKRGR
jgi:hypothetical protein